MRHPPYHLRLNKAVDRFALIEAIKRLEKLDGDLSAYTYYGLGGPYLEDFRMLYEFYPDIKMVSIEEDKETYKRQKFHLPCGTIRLQNARFKSFLSQYQANDEKSIFWLDYTGLEYGHFEDFMVLLSKVAAFSMIKITLRADPTDYMDREAEDKKAEEFRKKFVTVMPNPTADPPTLSDDFAYLVQEMLQTAAQQALSGAMPLMFQPVSSFHYSDGTGILTLTGIVCPRAEKAMVKRVFQRWQFANLNWAKPKRIDVPVLSTKERLHLQEKLPCLVSPGRTLRQALGYLIDDDKATTEARLKQYADFHRHFPYFLRGVP